MTTTEKKPVLVFQSPLFTQSGYGHRGLDIARCLLRINKWDLKIVATRWGSTPTINIEELIKTDSELSELVNRVLRANLSEQPEIYIQHTIPNEFQAPGKFNIGLTAGIETTLPRGEWIEGLNRMNLNMVSSNFARDVFKGVEYKKRDQAGNESVLKMAPPMEVLFEGADISVYKKTGTTSSSDVVDVLTGIKEDFAFLFVGHWLQGDIGADRKDIGMLIKTFTETFKNKKNAPALVLKTSHGGFSHMDKEEVLKKIKLCQSNIDGTLPNVYLLHGELTDDEMNDLYNHPKIKAHVSFTHGEGYGRPLLEASLSGKPVITSDWSGHKDFLNENSVLLPGEVKNVHPSAVNEWIIKESSWFTVNYSFAARSLNDVFENYPKYLAKSEKLAKENSEKFSLGKMQKELDSLLTKSLPVFPKKQQIVLPKLKKVELPVAV